MINVSNYALLARNTSRMAKGDTVVLRFDKKFKMVTYEGCNNKPRYLSDMPENSEFYFSDNKGKQIVATIMRSENASRLVIEGTFCIVSIFVERVGKYSSFAPYGSRLNKLNSLKKSNPMNNVSENIFSPEVEKNKITPSLSQEKLKFIVQCKIDGTLNELIDIATSVNNGTRKLGMSVTIDV